MYICNSKLGKISRTKGKQGQKSQNREAKKQQNGLHTPPEMVRSGVTERREREGSNGRDR